MADKTEEIIPFNFFKKIPKVELHAHLNGSISRETIEKLIKKKSSQANHECLVKQWETTIKEGDKTTLEKCLLMFDLIYQLVDDVDTVTLVTRAVIEDFAQDNVKYLELRSTPRANPKTGMTKTSYIDAVLLGIEEAKKTSPNISVRCLLAINRKHNVDDALDTVQLAVHYKDTTAGTILGIDLSGDPMANTSHDFVPALRLAQEQGLKCALHIAEAPGIEEARVLLDIIPDRIGHGTCIHPEAGGTQELVDFVERHSIPIELCLTSNVKTKTVLSYNDHHMSYWYRRGHPCIVCTDDKGVFSTSLSEEYSIMAKTFDLTKEEVWELSYKSIDCIFAGDSIKDLLRKIWNSEKVDLLNKLQ